MKDNACKSLTCLGLTMLMAILSGCEGPAKPRQLPYTPRAQDLLLRLETSSLSIASHDVLFVKIVINNLRNRPAWLNGKIGSLTGSLRFYLRRPGEQTFSYIRQQDEGKKSFSDPRTIVRPLGQYVVYHILWKFLDKNLDRHYVFPTAGRYQLIAEIGSINIRVRTPAQLVSVNPKRMLDKAHLDKHLKTKGWLGTSSISHFGDPKKLQAFIDGLADSNLRTWAHWSQAVLEMRGEKNAEKKKALDQKLASMIAAMDPVMADIARLTLGFEYYKQRRYDDAIAVYKQIKQRSDHRDGLVRQIRGLTNP